MTAGTTNISKPAMDCARVTREEILERYLTSTLADEDREVFEEHFFGCERCFQELQALRSIQTELQRGGTPVDAVASPFRRWALAAALAASVVLAGTAVLLMRTPPSSRAVEPSASNSPAAGPGVERPSAPGDNGPAAEPPGPSLETLARFEPPPYEPLVLRGTLDEAMTRFQTGMGRYRKADYRGAIGDLRAAAALAPDMPAIPFFLGIAHLMSGDHDAAIDRLRATVRLGDSAYVDDAHWYLAKAFLQQGNIARAQSELQAIVERSGARADEARRLLAEVMKLKAISK